VLSNGDWLLPVALWTRDRMGGPGVDKEAHKDLDVIRMANVVRFDGPRQNVDAPQWCGVSAHGLR